MNLEDFINEIRDIYECATGLTFDVKEGDTPLRLENLFNALTKQESEKEVE